MVLKSSKSWCRISFSLGWLLPTLFATDGEDRFDPWVFEAFEQYSLPDHASGSEYDGLDFHFSVGLVALADPANAYFSLIKSIIPW